MTEHTPEPWIAKFDYVEDSSRRSIASCNSSFVPDDEARANARFIAAAPDMFTLLLNLVVDGDIALATRMVISATLAKARGE